MSAETLRKAAALMRQRAEAAFITRSPWGFAATEDMGFAVHYGEHDTVALYANRADAEHIASWHPTVALAVANLLDDAAQNADLLADGGELGPQHDTIMRRIAHSHALTVARAYLGRDA